MFLEFSMQIIFWDMTLTNPISDGTSSPWSLLPSSQTQFPVQSVLTQHCTPTPSIKNTHIKVSLRCGREHTHTCTDRIKVSLRRGREHTHTCTDRIKVSLRCGREHTHTCTEHTSRFPWGMARKHTHTCADRIKVSFRCGKGAHTHIDRTHTWRFPSGVEQRTVEPAIQDIWKSGHLYKLDIRLWSEILIHTWMTYCDNPGNQDTSVIRALLVVPKVSALHRLHSTHVRSIHMKVSFRSGKGAHTHTHICIQNTHTHSRTY